MAGGPKPVTAGGAAPRFAAAINARPQELAGVLLATACVFCMFSAYSILRPIRETMGITSGVITLPALFWGTFVVMLAVQPVYGWLTSRFRRSTFLPWVYLFFVLNILGFYAWFNLQADHTWIARVYFVWLSVFNLFVVAVFWSLMADIFDREQAGRLFGFIAAGISLGGLTGARLGAALAQPIGTINLLLVSAGLLALRSLADARGAALAAPVRRRDRRVHGRNRPGCKARRPFFRRLRAARCVRAISR